MAEITFFMNKTKKMNNIEKSTLILAKLKKLASKFVMNIMKMGKTLKSERFIIILAKMWAEVRKLSYIFRFERFSHFYLTT